MGRGELQVICVQRWVSMRDVFGLHRWLVVRCSILLFYVASIEFTILHKGTWGRGGPVDI